MHELLQQGLSNNVKVRQVRHLGLLLAVEMNEPCQSIVADALALGLLINVTAEKVIRLLPPLIIDAAQTSEIADILIHCINSYEG